MIKFSSLGSNKTFSIAEAPMHTLLSVNGGKDGLIILTENVYDDAPLIVRIYPRGLTRIVPKNFIIPTDILEVYNESISNK